MVCLVFLPTAQNSKLELCEHCSSRYIPVVNECTRNIHFYKMFLSFFLGNGSPRLDIGMACGITANYYYFVLLEARNSLGVVRPPIAGSAITALSKVWLPF